MEDEDLLDRIRVYVRANRTTFTTEAMRKRLLKDGVPSEAIDRVFAENAAEPRVQPDEEEKPSISTEDLVYVVLGVFAVSCIAIVLNTVAAAALTAGGWPELVIVYSAGLVVMFMAAVSYVRSRGVRNVRIVIAIALIPLVIGGALMGACFAIFS